MKCVHICIQISFASTYYISVSLDKLLNLSKSNYFIFKMNIIAFTSQYYWKNLYRFV